MSETPFLRRQLPYRFYNVTLTLIVINVALFLAQQLFRNITGYLALTPLYVIRAKAYWQVVTYMFVHGGTFHILFNMLALFIFGTQLERKLGSTEFLVYYLVTGVGAGLFILVFNWYSGLAVVRVVGASGAIYGLLLAYATLLPDSRLYIFGILPLKAPVAVLLFAGIAIFSQLTGTRGGVAHLAHLAGLGFGYLYFLIRLGINPIKVFFRHRGF